MTTAQQLREALGRARGVSLHTDDGALIALFDIRNVLPTLLDEHEKLEREAEAGRALAEAILKCNEDVSVLFPKDVYLALSAYHTACGKGEGV